MFIKAIFEKSPNYQFYVPNLSKKLSCECFSSQAKKDHVSIKHDIWSFCLHDMVMPKNLDVSLKYRVGILT